MNKTARTILIAVLAIVLVGGGIFVGMNWNHWFGDKPVTADVDDSAELTIQAIRTLTQERRIQILLIFQGLYVMNFKAGTTEQSVNLYNPGANACYFKMTIFLNGGTVLWESKLVEPNKAIYDYPEPEPFRWRV